MFYFHPTDHGHPGWRAALLPDWIPYWCKVKALPGKLVPAGHRHVIPHSETLLTTPEMTLGGTTPFAVTLNAHSSSNHRVENLNKKTIIHPCYTITVELGN